MKRLIDISHPLESGLPAFPGDPQIAILPHGTIASAGYNLTWLGLSSHQGTHVDAPFHFFDEGKAIDRIPLETFHGPAFLVDLAPGGHLQPQAEITEAMLGKREEAFHPGARAILRTGWDRLYGKPEYFERYPSLTPDALRWIASRRIALLGMDTPSPSVEWGESHRILLGGDPGIAILECLANLHLLPAEFTLAAFPLNLKGRDGAPVRAVAIVQDERSGSA